MVTRQVDKFCQKKGLLRTKKGLFLPSFMSYFMKEQDKVDIGK